MAVESLAQWEVKVVHTAHLPLVLCQFGASHFHFGTSASASVGTDCPRYVCLHPAPCSVEDIQGLMLLAPKGCKPRPALMATYYAKLTQIFTKSESRLYSAYAWYRCGGSSMARVPCPWLRF